MTRNVKYPGYTLFIFVLNMPVFAVGETGFTGKEVFLFR